MGNEPIDILMRFSDKLGAIDDTVAAHKKVIDKKGAVWFGKMGKTLARRHIVRINSQCEDGIPTHLFLVQSSKRRYEVYLGELLEVARRLPLGQRELIPSYYEANHIIKYMTLWSKVADLRPLDSPSLSKIYVAATGSRISEALRTSMAGLFIVRISSDLSLTKRS